MPNSAKPELSLAYNPQESEDKIYKLWEESGFFNPDICVTKKATKTTAKPFSIVLPPPNVTGTLHMGHAAMLAIEDILIRYHRMKGEKTLWLPGTDHAAIATESKVEQLIYKKEEKTRRDLGKEEFLNRVKQFAKESHDTIVHQIKKMGASLDWSREAYTLDEKRNLAVRTAFKQMFNMGLIYRGHRIINWDPKGQTTISDDEIVYQERETTLYTFKYSKDFPIAISSTRPETKVGDVAVAVHPNDARYTQYIGKTYNVMFAGVPLCIKIIADEIVDKTFGTGALGVTPAHSQIDWEIAQRHSLPLLQVINEYGKMMIENPELKNKKTAEAREHIVQWLRQEKLLEKENVTKQNVPTAERSGAVIEPLPKTQWFVAVNKEFAFPHTDLRGIKKGQLVTLKKLMTHVVKTKQITVVPEHFEKTYFHWIDNLHDWCISRQIWFGHQIPVWYQTKKSKANTKLENETEVYVGVTPPLGEEWTQDPDTLDTWFSSGLWTFSTLGWPHFTQSATQDKPNQKNDFTNFHPTSVLETGYDILFFWIARMILMSTCLIGQIPFKTVYLHGLVRDNQGRKMSKSLGNIIDPLTMIEKYGADATRLSLIIGAAPGNDLKLSEDRVRGYRNFANKLWNIARFIQLSTQDFPSTSLETGPSTSLGTGQDKKPVLTLQDKKILATFSKIKKSTTHLIDSFRLSQAAEDLYHYTWHTFADKILEESKEVLQNKKMRESRQYVLLFILKDLLILLHPFTPFITESLYQTLNLPDKKESLMIEKWPTL